MLRRSVILAASPLPSEHSEWKHQTVRAPPPPLADQHQNPPRPSQFVGVHVLQCSRLHPRFDIRRYIVDSLSIPPAAVVCPAPTLPKQNRVESKPTPKRGERGPDTP